MGSAGEERTISSVTSSSLISRLMKVSSRSTCEQVRRKHPRNVYLESTCSTSCSSVPPFSTERTMVTDICLRVACSRTLITCD